MILGSHNTMTYLTPKKWWMKLGKFIAKCQNKTIEEQYKAGARWFDLRIAFPDNNSQPRLPFFSHGLIDYKGRDVESILKFLNEKNAYCRIVLEKGGENEEIIFKFWVTNWMKSYPNIKFTQIAKKGQWINLLEPNGEPPFELKDYYASCNGDYPQYQNWPGILRSKTWSGYILDDLWPWIYARFHNKKAIQKYKNQDIVLLLDFIGNKW